MQEGILSLMQMAKTSLWLNRLSQEKIPFIVLITNPTMAGVMASYASLGDFTLAEPGAMMGFAGGRVIEQTIGSSLPEGFQTAEFFLTRGFVDQVVPRTRLRETLVKILGYFPTGRRRKRRNRKRYDGAAARQAARGRYDSSMSLLSESSGTTG